jgi:hypothetical protein
MAKTHQPKIPTASTPVWSHVVLLASIILAASLRLYSVNVLLDPFSPLAPYPAATNVETTHSDTYPIRGTVTVFHTDDTPDQVYRFYRTLFFLRPLWRPRAANAGLMYSFSLGCPVGTYTIHAASQGGYTQVTVSLSTHVCI